MNLATVLIPLSAALISASALAQSAKEGERPIRPDIASNAAIGGWCDALTGAKKEECLRDERRREQEARKEDPRTRGTCDALVGSQKEECLRKGGTVEVGATSGAGRTAREH
jgi:hypothetical protein